MSRHRHRSRPGRRVYAFLPCDCDKVLLEATGYENRPCGGCGAEPVQVHARSAQDALQQRTRILAERQVAA